MPASAEASLAGGGGDAGAGRWCRAVRDARQAPGDRRHLDARARAACPGAARVRAGSVHDAVRVRQPARCRSRSAATRTTRARSVHTVRAVGLATRAICRRSRRRGARRARAVRPPVAGGESSRARDVLVVAGGIGLAPLRPAILALLARRERYGRLVLLYGGRSPDQLLYADELRAVGRARAGRRRSPSTAPARSGSATSASCRGSCAAPSSSPPAPRRSLCGPEVMMRFTVAALARAGVAGGRVYASMERNMQCGIGHCGHCQLGPTLDLPRRTGLPLERARRLAGDPGAVMARRAQADAGRVEVRLLRRLPAEPARLRGRAARARRAAADRLLPGGEQRDRRGALRRLARRGLDHHRARRRAHPRGARELAGADHDRRLRDRRRDPGAAQLRRRRGASPRSCTPRPDYISTLATSTPISAHVPVDFELQRLPDQQAPAARGDQRPPGRAPPARARPQRVRRVQAAGHRVRDGRPRHALPGPGHARRLRRDLPGLRPRLLRLLRADGEPQHRRAERAHGASSAASEIDIVRVYRTFNAAHRAVPRGRGQRA